MKVWRRILIVAILAALVVAVAIIVVDRILVVIIVIVLVLVLVVIAIAPGSIGAHAEGARLAHKERLGLALVATTTGTADGELVCSEK